MFAHSHPALVALFFVFLASWGASFIALILIYIRYPQVLRSIREEDPEQWARFSYRGHVLGINIPIVNHFSVARYILFNKTPPSASIRALNYSLRPKYIVLICSVAAMTGDLIAVLVIMAYF